VIRKLEEEQQIRILFQLGRDLTKSGIIQGSDERRMFEEFIDRTGFEQFYEE